MTAKEVLEHFGVHPKVIDEFWRFISMSILNLPLEECSGAAFFRFVRYLCGRKEFRAGFAKCGLGELFADQSVSIIEAAGGRVLTQARVDSLVLEGGQVVGVKLKSGEELRASSVVSGLAPQDLSQLLNRSGSFALFSEKLAKFESCPYISIYLWFDRSLIDRAFWAREYQPQDLNCDFYDLSKFRSGWSGRPSIIASNIIYSHRAHAMSDSEIVKKTLHELSEFIPQANQAMLVHSVVNRIPMAIHCPRPGVESLRPKPLGSVANLILAGDWTDTSMPSSMESACHSGFVAAELILKQRKIPQKEILATQLPGPDAWVHWNAKIWNRILN
jgi:15-cis-phytoene desaturase